MNECKIEVANEAESKEIQNLFFDLGCTWLGGDSCVKFTDARYLFVSENLTITCRAGDYFNRFNASSNRLITLPELRVLASLKRNDVNDATHEDEHGDKWLISGGEYHLFNCSDEWLKADEVVARHNNVKPITPKNEITLAEAVERLSNDKATEFKRPRGWELIQNHHTIYMLLNATAFRVPVPNLITLNGTEYTKDGARKLIEEHFA